MKSDRWINLRRGVTAAVFGTTAFSVHAASVNSTWDFSLGGGDGIHWADKNNWSNPDASDRFPANNGIDTFDVSIGTATVKLAGATIAGNVT